MNALTITRAASTGIGIVGGAVHGARTPGIGAIPGAIGGGATGLAVHEMVFRSLAESVGMSTKTAETAVKLLT